MPNRKINPKDWPPIRKIQYANGTSAWQVACMINGKRLRHTYPTKGEAESKADEIRTKLANEGVAALSLSDAHRVEASKCIERLKPHKVTLTEAVDYFIEHVVKFRSAPNVTAIVEKMVADAKSNNRRERTIGDLKIRLGVFAEDYGDRQIASITREEVVEWLNDPELSARSRINYATKLSQMWNYAIANGWAENNIPASVPRPNAEDSEPGIFTVKQAGMLLTHAEQRGLLGYVVLGLFAGLRSAEIQRLDWSHVKLAEKSIIIGAEVAKKRSRRVVDINDTLAAWLPSCAQVEGPVLELESARTLYARLAKLAEDAGLKKWPDNGLRHSCATYSLAQCGDAVRVAHQLGNSPDMIHRHYKALVSKSEAERYFALKPSEASEKVIPLAANG